MGDSLKLHISYINNNNDVSDLTEVTFEGKQVSCAQLQEKVTETFGVAQDDFDMYCGLKCLKCTPEQSIEDLGLSSGSRLHIIQKKIPAPQKETESIDFSTIRNAAYGLHTMFQHSQQMRRRNKSAIIKLFEDRAAMDEIIASVDGLAEDQAALDILENIKLFEAMVDPKITKEIIENNPRLANAFVAIWNSLMSSSRYSNFDPVAGSASGSQESMEVDEQRFVSPPAGGRPGSSNRREANQSSARIITSSQLADAIALATTPAGAAFPYSAYNTPTPASNSQSPMPSQSRSTTGTPSSAGTRQNQPRQNIITPDVFSQAMQQALMSTGLQQVAETLQNDGATGTTPSISEEAMQNGLTQLRSMGISDEEASRQALTATQGNVEAAVNLLFSGT